LNARATESAHLRQAKFDLEILSGSYNTLVHNCCKGDLSCQWNTPTFRPSGIETRWTDRHQTW